MMHLILRNRRRCARKNPVLGAVLGAFSALMIGAATFLGRHDGAHWPVSLAIVLCIAAVAAVVVRLVIRNRGDRK